MLPIALRCAPAIALAFAIAGCNTPAQQKSAALPAVTPIMVPPAMAAGSGDQLVGRTWAWQATELPGDRQMIPEAPERYTLQFMPDGSVQLRVDCNRGGAKYQVGANGALTLGPAFLTKIGCPAGSKDSEFVRQLSEVSGYRFADGDLLLAFRSEGGAMRFAPMMR